MKKTIYSLIFTLCLPISTVSAEYALENNSEILGLWTVDAESPKLNGFKRALNQEWEFKQNGEIVSTSIDTRANSSISVTLKYWVENGKIRKETRPGKTEICTVVEKEGPGMILYCRNLYFFLTKK